MYSYILVLVSAVKRKLEADKAERESMQPLLITDVLSRSLFAFSVKTVTDNRQGRL